MPLILRPESERRHLPDRLAALGRARRRAALAAGVFQVLAVLVAVVALAGVLDFALDLPAAVRALFLVAVLAAAGVGYLRWVRGPAREAVHPLAVALRLEEAFPRLNDSLASAVDFLQGEHAERSRFRRVAITRAENLAGRYDIDRIVPSGRAWRAFWLAVLALAVALPLALVNTAAARLAVVRLADPFGEHPWPTRTIVEVLHPTPGPTGHYLLARGEPFPLRFIVRGVLPERAVVSVRLAGAGVVEEGVALPVEPHQTEVTADVRLDPDQVPRDFEFKIAANDFETRWIPVTVAPAPKLIHRDGRPSPLIDLEFPAYTGLAPVELPPGTGVVEAVAGTRVSFRAAADRRIVDAVLVNTADPATLAAALAATTVVGGHPLNPLAAQMLADEALAPIPVRVSGPEGTELDADFIPHRPGLHALRFTDESGLTGVRTFDFRIFPDPAPLVVLERPAPGRDALTLLPTASVLVRARSEDRPFAVRSLFIEYQVGQDAPVRTLPLADLDAAAAALPAVAGPDAARARPRPVSLDGDRVVPLARFLKPDGTPPADGDVITLWAAATDWDDRTALKAPGRSKDRVDIHVLARQSLEALFEEKLTALRPDLLRVREEQRAARARARELAAAAAEGKPAPPDGPSPSQLEQDQRGVNAKVADPAAGLRARAEELRQTARANRLPPSPTTDRIEAVADELGRVADRHLEPVEPLIKAARLEAEAAPADPKKLAELLGQVDRHQKAAEAGLSRALDRLEQWSGPGEVRGQARHLKDQLNRAGEQANKAADNIPDGKMPSQLSPAEKSDLAVPAARLDDVADQAAELVARAGRIAGEKEAKAKASRAEAEARDREAARLEAGARGPDDPAHMKAQALRNEAEGLRLAADRAQAEADVLRKAVRDTGDALPQDLRRAADALRDNQPQRSAEARQHAGQKLDRLSDGLAEEPRDAPDQLRRKLDQFGAEIDKLAEQQDELRKKARDAGQITDPVKRADELAKLAREQEKLTRQAEQLAEKLTRERADRPADAVRRAAEQMEAARGEIEQGRAPAEKQDEALDRLDEALDRIDREQQENREQLTREKREQLLEQVKRIRDKQKAAIDEANRIQADVVKAKEWSRGLAVSLRDLAEIREQPLAGELRPYAEKNLADLPVFQRLAMQSADAMERAARYTLERYDDLRNRDDFDPELEALDGRRILKPMETALRRLDQILDTLKEDPKDPAQAGGSGGGAGGMDADPGDQGPGIPPLAQLKALRAMQAEVNERTAAFAKAHPDPDKLTDDERDELKELEQAQRDVAELFDKLAPAFRPQVQEPE